MYLSNIIFIKYYISNILYTNKAFPNSAILCLRSLFSNIKLWVSVRGIFQAMSIVGQWQGCGQEPFISLYINVINISDVTCSMRMCALEYI
jgi:hypothetical protein